MFTLSILKHTAVSMGNDHFDNHAWFVEALNNSGILSRVVSDSAAAVDNCLLNLDDYDISASRNDENTNNNAISARGGGGGEFVLS